MFMNSKKIKPTFWQSRTIHRYLGQSTNQSLGRSATFALPGNQPEPLPAWAELLELPPTPELVGEGRVVVDHNFITDAEDSSLLWLELSVHDMRADGQGLVGLELDMDWNASALELIDELNTKDQVFNADHLPLFQNLGKAHQARGAGKSKAWVLQHCRAVGKVLPWGSVRRRRPNTLRAAGVPATKR